MITLAIIATPAHGATLRHCLASAARHAREPFATVIVTEPAQVGALRALVPGAETAAMPAEALAIPRGYYRQMAAKLLLPRVTEATHLVITDDDTEAIGRWGAETFFEGERARLFHKASRQHPWRRGSEAVFQSPCRRTWLFRLPFAVHRRTLERLAASEVGARCLQAWHAGRRVSEFEVMGEFAARTGDPAALLTSSTLWHWSVGLRPAFRDWQGQRPQLARRLARSFPP